MNVTTVHKDYANMLSRWELMKALYDGEHGVHEAAEKYLPRLHQEEDKAYAARLKMTPLFNATYRTISGMRGMIFRKPPIITIPPALEEMMQDVDLAGTTLINLLQKITDASLTFGRYGLLVDYPQTDAEATRADAKTLNYRPMMVLYNTTAVYNWRTSRINGVTVLTRVQLEEEDETIDPENEFKVKCDIRYRILDLDDAGDYRQRVFKKAKNGIGEPVQDGDDIYPMMNGAKMKYIPFVFLGADCYGSHVEPPPLIDLATTNIHHYMQASSYERGCFFSGLPTMFISGVDPTDTEIAIGGVIANVLPRPDSRAYYVEVAGEFGALRNNLSDKKGEMAVLGARMLESQKAGVEASDTIARRQNGELSLLASIAATIEAGSKQALQWFADWAGASGEIDIQINRDYVPSKMSAQDIAGIVAAWQSGAISQETLFDNLKSGEIIDNDITFEDEQSRIGSALIPPMNGAPPTNAPPPLDASQQSAAMPDNSAQQAMLDQILAAVSQPAPSLDMQSIVDAIAAIPAPIINVAAPIVNVPAPIVNVAAAPEQQQAIQPIVLQTGTGGKVIQFQKDASGRINGATVNEASVS